MQKSTFLALTAMLVGIAGLSMALIAMGTTRWVYDVSSGAESGLFESCTTRRAGCTLAINSFADYVKAAAAFMILGGILSLGGIVAALMTSFGTEKTSKAGGAMFLIAGVFLLIACACYTGSVRSDNVITINFGFSLWLAWAATLINLLASPILFLATPDRKFIA